MNLILFVCVCVNNNIDLHPDEAIILAKKCRPIIDLIGTLPQILHRYHRIKGIKRKK